MSSRDFGTEVLRVEQAEDVERLDEWIHDAYVEDALEFDAEAQRAVIPFAQESANLSDPLPSMADPVLVERTPLAELYEVPFTRCFVVVSHARSLDAEIDWGYPVLEDATYRDSTLRLSGTANLTIAVTTVDVRVFVTAEESGRRLRKRHRGGWESDRPLNPPA
jgi:hypothetical protein